MPARTNRAAVERPSGWGAGGRRGRAHARTQARTHARPPAAGKGCRAAVSAIPVWGCAAGAAVHPSPVPPHPPHPTLFRPLGPTTIADPQPSLIHLLPRPPGGFPFCRPDHPCYPRPAHRRTHRTSPPPAAACRTVRQGPPPVACTRRAAAGGPAAGKRSHWRRSGFRVEEARVWGCSGARPRGAAAGGS